MNKNELSTYAIIKQMKRLNEHVSSSKIQLFTLAIGFVLNAMTIILTMIKDCLPEGWFVGIGCGFIIFPITIIGTFWIAKAIKERIEVVPRKKAYELNTSFDEYVLPNIRCALEAYDEYQTLDTNASFFEERKTILSQEITYRINCAAKEMANIATTPKQGDFLIKKERWDIILKTITGLQEMGFGDDLTKHFQVYITEANLF